jgi:hypothetical protein
MEEEKINEIKKEEVAILIPAQKAITATSGKSYDLPKLFYGHNIKLNAMLKNLVDGNDLAKIMELLNSDSLDDEKQKILMDMMCVITGLEEMEIMNNFDLVDIVVAVTSFFANRSRKFISKMNETLNIKSEPMQK